MSEATKFFDGIMGEAFSELHTCMLGRVKSFNGTKMQADVIPLFKRKLADGREEPMPVISQAPVMFLYANGFFVRPPLKPGDLVVVVFAERELDAVLLSGSEQAPSSNRQHGLEDAIVIGGWLPFAGSLPVPDDGDLYIGHKSNGVRIKVTQSGEVHIKASKVSLGDFDASEGVSLGDSLKSWLDNHKHDCTGCAGITKPPSTSSPAPSQVVKTV